MNVIKVKFPRSVVVQCVSITALAISSLGAAQAGTVTSGTTIAGQVPANSIVYSATNGAADEATNVVGTNVSGADEHRIPSIVAVIETRFKPTRNVYERLRVQLSESGFSFEDTLDGVGMVVDFKNIKAWFVDPVREVVHSIPITPVKDAPMLPVAQVRLPHYIDSTPCVGGGGQHVEDKVFKDRKVQVWRCTPMAERVAIPKFEADLDSDPGSDSDSDPGPGPDLNAEQNPPTSHDVDLFESAEFLAAQKSLKAEWPVEQFYDSELNLVVYSRNSAGFESELMYVRKQDPEKQIYLPPDDYKKVSIEEYLSWETPVVKLEAYNN